MLSWLRAGGTQASTVVLLVTSSTAHADRTLLGADQAALLELNGLSLVHRVAPDVLWARALNSRYAMGVSGSLEVRTVYVVVQVTEDVAASLRGSGPAMPVAQDLATAVADLGASLQPLHPDATDPSLAQY